jgi:hypothetical protein
LEEDLAGDEAGAEASASVEAGAEDGVEVLVGASALVDGGGVTCHNIRTHILHMLIHRQQLIQGTPMTILNTDIIPMQPIHSIQQHHMQDMDTHIPIRRIHGTGKEVKNNNVTKTKKI